MTRNFIVLTAAALALASSGCEKLKARDNLNRGVAAFKGAKYADAERYFLKAVELDPTYVTSHLYLATAYVNQYIPGADSPENNRMADNAFKAFNRVLEMEPTNIVATASIASLYFQKKEFDKAVEWNKKLIAIDPNNKDAYYTLGVIAWTKWLVPDREARNKMGMKPEDPGPLKDKKAREELKAQYLPILNDGIENMKKSLEIDKDYDEAMAYMNLLIRYRADLMDTADDYKKESEIADNWVQKALATKKVKAEKAALKSGGIVNDVK
ncbi:MAG: tetratricopeptide repeat protein [Acidobacteria bacterium]|nr:tetratricopeptide repeat protein [Acidobacteriota bacterium]